MAKKAAQKATPKKEPKAKAAPAPEPPKAAAPKKHARTAKPSETERLEKGRKLVASYLEQRDGMDPQLALDVVEGMGADEINALITEANTAVIERTKALHPELAARLTPDAKETIPDFTTIEALVSDDTFPELVSHAADAARRKNIAEVEAKTAKAILFAKLTAAGIKADRDKVTVMGYNVAPYRGESASIDKIMLLEAGVSIDTINKCYKRTPYNDVRITRPGSKAKEE